MKRIRNDNRRQRQSIILDAGYVSIKSSEILGLYGKKFICVILTVFILFSISCINLTCLIWIMYKLDWSPFYRNGSKIFSINKINHQIEFYNQGTFYQPIYTTKINDSLSINLTSEEQIDTYGDFNSILFDDNQIALNTEYFNMNEKFLVDFNNFQLYKFYKNPLTKIHLDQISTRRIYNRYLNILTDHSIKTSDVNNVLFTTKKNLTIEANKRLSQSIVRFDNYPKTKYSYNYRQKRPYGNINLQTDSIFLNLPRYSFVEDKHRNERSIYRLCICNTTLLLLRSFAHQPCPLC